MERWIVGVDENGFGPRLGPLTATAASISIDDYDPERLAAIARAHGVDDSKANSRFGAMKVAESIALALAARETGSVPGSADAFFDALALGGTEALRVPCPSAHVGRQCFDEPLPLPAFGGDAREGERVLLAVEREGGLRLERVRTTLACAAVLNREREAGVSKTRVDLGLFERLLRDARAASGRDLVAICGMIGGIRDVPAYTREFSAEDFDPIVLERDVRAYDLRGVGRVRFETSADANHMPVALASMVGKYARELGNHRIVGFYRARKPELPMASGYHDPVTTRFIEGAAAIREGEGIPEACFLRGA